MTAVDVDQAVGEFDVPACNWIMVGGYLCTHDAGHNGPHEHVRIMQRLVSVLLEGELVDTVRCPAGYTGPHGTCTLFQCEEMVGHPGDHRHYYQPDRFDAAIEWSVA